MTIILVDSREQQAAYIVKRFMASGIDADIICWPQETGCDYLITNTHGSCAIQRKVAVSELINELDETLHETLPRLKNFSDNPILLIEENFGINESGFLFNQNDSRETDMKASGYFGYLETVRKSGVDVITTRNLNQSLWWMMSMHGYLAKQHYPKHRKYHTIQEQAVGMLTAVATIGDARATKALKGMSIREMCGKYPVEGLTAKQNERLQKVLEMRL